MKQTITVTSDAYARLLCIETNELEDVFRLSGQSNIRLVHGGFFINAIQHFDESSKIKDKRKTIAILKDVELALSKIHTWTQPSSGNSHQI